MNVKGHIYLPVSTRYLDSTGRQVSKDTPGARKRQVRGKTYRARYVDANGRTQTSSLGTADRDTAQMEFAKLIERLKLNSLDPYAEHRERPVGEHLADYVRSLERKNKSEKHLAKVSGYVGRIIQECGFRTIADFDAEHVAEYLHDRRQLQPVSQVSLKHVVEVLSDVDVTTTEWRLRKLSLPVPSVAARQGSPALWDWRELRTWLNDRFGCSLPRICPIPDSPGISDFAFNDHVAAMKAFSNWLVKHDRMLKSPFRVLSKLNPEESELRHERRAATQADFEALLTSAAQGQPFRGLTGPDRAMLYLVAVSTGYRASELRSLTRESFEVETRPATVVLHARHSKRRKRDPQPLRNDVANLVQVYLEEIRSRRPKQIWPGTWAEKGAVMVRKDLEAAGLSYRDEGGRVLDFHSLRSTFATNLARAGVSPAKAQELMRHSDVNLTMRLYKKLELSDLAEAVEQLPAIAPGISVAAKVAVDPVNLTGIHGLSGVTHVQTSGTESNPAPSQEAQAGGEVMVKLAAHKKEPPVRLELTTYALRKRRDEIVKSESASSSRDAVGSVAAKVAFKSPDNSPEATPDNDVECVLLRFPAPVSEADSQLAELTDLWLQLPPDARAGVLSLLRDEVDTIPGLKAA